MGDEIALRRMMESISIHRLSIEEAESMNLIDKAHMAYCIRRVNPYITKEISIKLVISLAYSIYPSSVVCSFNELKSYMSVEKIRFLLQNEYVRVLDVSLNLNKEEHDNILMFMKVLEIVAVGDLKRMTNFYRYNFKIFDNIYKKMFFKSSSKSDLKALSILIADDIFRLCYLSTNSQACIPSEKVSRKVCNMTEYMYIRYSTNKEHYVKVDCCLPDELCRVDMMDEAIEFVVSRLQNCLKDSENEFKKKIKFYLKKLYIECDEYIGSKWTFDVKYGWNVFGNIEKFNAFVNDDEMVHGYLITLSEEIIKSIPIQHPLHGNRINVRGEGGPAYTMGFARYLNRACKNHENCESVAGNDVDTIEGLDGESMYSIIPKKNILTRFKNKGINLFIMYTNID